MARQLYSMFNESQLLVFLYSRYISPCTFELVLLYVSLHMSIVHSLSRDGSIHVQGRPTEDDPPETWRGGSPNLSMTALPLRSRRQTAFDVETTERSILRQASPQKEKSG